MSYLIPFTALLATFLFSISTILSKFLISDIKNPFRLLRVQLSMNLFVVSILLIIASFTGIDILLNLDVDSLFIIGLSGTFVFIGFVLFYLGLMEGNTSVAAVITSSRVLISVIIGFLFFKENFPIDYYLWIILILFGVLFVSWSPSINIQELFLLKANGTGFFVASVTSWAIANSFTRLLNNNIFLFTLVVSKLIVIVFLSFLTYPLFTKYIKQDHPTDIDNKFTSTTIIKILIYLIFFTLADLLITYAVGESLTITESISTLQGIIVFLLVIALSVNKKLRKVLNEELSNKTIVIRGIGVLIALVGGINMLLF